MIWWKIAVIVAALIIAGCLEASIRWSRYEERKDEESK